MLEKIKTEQQLLAWVEQQRIDGRKIVFTNGCFDILHAGHVRYLQAARQLGDCLLVALNSDSSVRGFKGPERPINQQDDRAEVLAGLQAVDAIVIFEERTPAHLVANIKPDYYVKGGDYNVADLPEAAVVAQYGGETVLIPEVIGRSTSNVIRKMRGE